MNEMPDKYSIRTSGNDNLMRQCYSIGDFQLLNMIRLVYDVAAATACRYVFVSCEVMLYITTIILVSVYLPQKCNEKLIRNLFTYFHTKFE